MCIKQNTNWSSLSHWYQIADIFRTDLYIWYIVRNNLRHVPLVHVDSSARACDRRGDGWTSNSSCAQWLAIPSLLHSTRHSADINLLRRYIEQRLHTIVVHNVEIFTTAPGRLKNASKFYYKEPRRVILFKEKTCIVNWLQFHVVISLFSRFHY